MLAEYWIDPAGRLFEIDYSGTQDFEEIPESERKSPFDSFRWVPNGSRGRVRAMNITTTIEVYPSEWNCHYAPFPRMDITFINGVLSTKQSESTWEQRYKALKRWVKEHYTNG